MALLAELQSEQVGNCMLVVQVPAAESEHTQFGTLLVPPAVLTEVQQH